MKQQQIKGKNPLALHDQQIKCQHMNTGDKCRYKSKSDNFTQLSESSSEHESKKRTVKKLRKYRQYSTHWLVFKHFLRTTMDTKIRT